MKTLWVQPLAGGVLVGIVGSFVPQVLGVGYVHVSALLNGHMAIRLAALLVALKLITVVFSSGSGNAGGIFAPVLFIGAMLGGTIGGLAHTLFPHHTGSPGAYALVGMGALFAGVIRTPMTSVVLVFEITRDYAIIVPLMIANTISFFISRKVMHETLYEGLTRQDGVHLPSAIDRSGQQGHLVFHVMRPVGGEFLAANMTIIEADRIAGLSHSQTWPVLGTTGGCGVVSSTELRHFLTENKGELSLESVLNYPVFPHVYLDHTFDFAPERMGASGLDLLPVVSRFDVHELLGVVHLSDVLAAYRLNVPSVSKRAQREQP